MTGAFLRAALRRRASATALAAAFDHLWQADGPWAAVHKGNACWFPRRERVMKGGE